MSSKLCSTCSNYNTFMKAKKKALSTRLALLTSCKTYKKSKYFYPEKLSSDSKTGSYYLDNK